MRFLATHLHPVLTVALACAMPPGQSIDSGLGVVIFDATLGPGLLPGECIPSSPEPVDDFWTPSVAQVREFEDDLARFHSMQELPEGAEPLSKHYRQVLGIVRSGRRLLFVNLFHERIMKLDPPWKTRLIGVCDGGPSYWTVLYDVETRRILDLSFMHGF